MREFSSATLRWLAPSSTGPASPPSSSNTRRSTCEVQWDTGQASKSRWWLQWCLISVEAFQIAWFSTFCWTIGSVVWQRETKALHDIVMERTPFLATRHCHLIVYNAFIIMNIFNNRFISLTLVLGARWLSSREDLVNAFVSNCLKRYGE